MKEDEQPQLFNLDVLTAVNQELVFNWYLVFYPSILDSLITDENNFHSPDKVLSHISKIEQILLGLEFILREAFSQING